MKKIVFVFLVLVLGCKTTEISKNEDNLEGINFTYNQNNEVIEFSLKNLNNEAVNLVKKNTLNIEKLQNGEWVRVKILPCPCDAPCREINDEIIIKPNESYLIKWNMIESWCSKERKEFIRETISQKAGKGKYRLKIQLIEGNNNKTIIKVFDIN